ncbi:MAG TPA: organic hydroperoxide resistance protein [Geminicoccaceae bacterium]|nr:organic hydroperoxide resistance protein [Geminicoccaceae bacterium]
MEPLHTSTVTAKGGREGFVRSENGVIDMLLTMPKVLGGKGAGQGTNPEELFAAGYAACFESAIRLVARRRDLELGDVAVTDEVAIGKEGDGFALAARVRGKLPGMDRAQAEELMNEAHKASPYSKATRGNMPVELVVEG